MFCQDQFFLFSNVYACFVLRHRIAVQLFVFFNFNNEQFFLFSNVYVCSVLRHRIAVQFFVFFNFNNDQLFLFSNVNVYFLLRHRIAVQFFVYLFIYLFRIFKQDDPSVKNKLLLRESCKKNIQTNR